MKYLNPFKAGSSPLRGRKLEEFIARATQWGIITLILSIPLLVFASVLNQ